MAPLVLALLMLSPTVAQGIPLPSGNNAPRFEVDGNVISGDDPAGTGLDWDGDDGVIEAVRNNDGTCTQTNSFQVGGPGVAGAGLLICDGSAGNFADTNTFGEGSKEEPGNWTIVSGGNPKKGDLAEVYVYAKVGDSFYDGDSNNDDLFLFGDLTRLDVNGSMNADLEFNQLEQTDCGDTGAKAANTFCQPRSVGDIIVAFDLAQGGNTFIPQVYEFRGASENPANCANAPKIKPPCYVKITPQGGGGNNPAAVGVVNNAEIEATDWRTVGCEVTQDIPQTGCRLRDRIPAKGNMEGYVDLSAFVSGFDLCPGFGQVTVKSRVSDSLNAALADATDPQAISVAICGSIVVQKENADGSALVGGAGFTFDKNPFTGGDPIEIDDGSADDQSAAAGILCIDQVLFDTYTVTETDVPDGYFGDGDSEQVVVAESTPCADRLDADGTLADGESPDVTFNNPKGSLIIRKEGKSAAEGGTILVGGAEFTITPSPLTGDDELVIDDDDANDAFDSTAGVICIDDVYNLGTGGSYSIIESDPPDGWAADEDTETVLIENVSLLTCAQRTSDAEPAVDPEDVTPDASFENIPLSEIEVIFRSLAGEGVTSATIDCEDAEGPMTKSSGDEDDDETFTDLEPGTYDCRVVIDP